MAAAPEEMPSPIEDPQARLRANIEEAKRLF
jgi:hypothetical protein